jgi:hypothetical protein
MTAFASLILLVCIASLSMCIVAYSNHLVRKSKQAAFRLEKMKLRAEELEDVVLVLDGLCEKRMIPKLVNDAIIDNYQTMIQINPKATYLKAGLSNAKMRSNDLSDESAYRHISRACKSDAQIARYRAYLAEALQILRKQHAEGRITGQEMQIFTLEIEWLHLQVKVISNIIQGHKAYNKQDILGANAFYKKAQNELLTSPHPDERRHKMITQMADLIFGRRKCLDPELMPEIEFNPDPDMEIDPLTAELTPEQMAVLHAQNQSVTKPHAPLS